MTSDAKIGLLLGLVFIFIIAFVINGLPSFHHKDDTNKLTTNMVGLESNTSGLGANERKVALESTAVTGARSTMALPQDAPAAADAAPVGPPVASPAAETGASVQTSPAVSTEPAITDSTQAVAAAKSQPAESKTYVVQQGDSISAIAKKVYGVKEGSKDKNITAIFEANRKTLASIDSLQIGQKLIIPPLPGSTVSSSTPADALPATGFTKVESVGQRHSTADTAKSATAAKADSSKHSSVYVVKDGDSLWKIAAAQLGDGNRYKEITKLNSDVLGGKDNLEVGMQLKMPAR
ncbi:MAG: LysM peptidoglycan-binding domain-containing protein [Sedimentisphaerales bacterium]|jgi:nucleoid-associated protein YgaU